MDFLGKAMSLLFNMMSRLVITFLPRIKRLLISWQQSPSSVILPHIPQPKIKSVTVSIVSACICHEVIGPDAMNLVYRYNIKEVENTFFLVITTLSFYS